MLNGLTHCLQESTISHCIVQNQETVFVLINTWTNIKSLSLLAPAFSLGYNYIIIRCAKDGMNLMLTHGSTEKYYARWFLLPNILTNKLLQYPTGQESGAQQQNYYFYFWIAYLWCSCIICYLLAAYCYCILLTYLLFDCGLGVLSLIL